MMLKMHEFIVVAIVGLLLFGGGLVRADSITTDLEAQEDNEGLSTFRYLVGYQDVYKNWVLGAKVGQFKVKDNAGQVNFDEVRFTFYRQFNKRLSTWGYIGYLNSKEYSLPTGDLGLGYIATDKLYLEFSASKNAFDTFKTNSNRTSYSNATTRAEYKLTNNLTGTGIVSLGDVSDGNRFLVYKGYLDYDLDSVKGLTLKYQHRNKSYDYAAPGYFTPEAWTRNLVGAGFKKSFSPSWSFNGSLLSGPQVIDNNAGNFTELRTSVQYKPYKKVTFKFTHDRTISTANSYTYKWNWTSIKFQYSF